MIVVSLSVAFLASGCGSSLTSVMGTSVLGIFGEVETPSSSGDDTGDDAITIASGLFDLLSDAAFRGTPSEVAIVNGDEESESQPETSEVGDTEETLEEETSALTEEASDNSWDPDHRLSVSIPDLNSDGLEMPVQGATAYASVSLPLWRNIPGQGSTVSMQSIDSSVSTISMLSNGSSGFSLMSVISGIPDMPATDNPPTESTTQATVPESTTQDLANGATSAVTDPGVNSTETIPGEGALGSSEGASESSSAAENTAGSFLPQPGESAAESVAPSFQVQPQETIPETTARPRTNSYSGALAVLEPGTPFTILQESGGWWLVKTDSHTGWVQNKYCLINLPDVIPSIIYNDTNSVSSIFRSSGKNIPGITGEQLYNCISYNPRLGKNEYLMPVLFPMAKTIARAQHNALKEGNTLVIYETYRPHDVQMEVASGLSDLAAADSEVNAGISSGGWNLGWFIARTMSNHQRGYAMDVSLAKVTGAELVTDRHYSYVEVTSYAEYTMPTSMHELSVAAVTFKTPVDSSSDTAWRDDELSDGLKNSEPGLALQRYCTDAGLSPLASEWWHFNDLSARAEVSDNQSTGGYHISKCMSIPVSEVASVLQDIE